MTFEVARTEFVVLVTMTPSPARLTVLKDLPDNYYANMVIQGVTSISTQGLNSSEHATAIIFALCAEEPAGTTLNGVGLRMIASHPGGAKLAKTTQRSTLLDHLEKVLKQGDKSKMMQSSILISLSESNESTILDNVQLIETLQTSK